MPGVALSYVVVTYGTGVEGLPLAGSFLGLFSTLGICNGVAVWVVWHVSGGEQPRQSSGTLSRTDRGGGGDVGYLEYQCEGCNTVLDDWRIDETGTAYTCGECGYTLDNQRAAREKVDEGWAWDEDEGLA